MASPWPRWPIDGQPMGRSASLLFKGFMCMQRSLSILFLRRPRDIKSKARSTLRSRGVVSRLPLGNQVRNRPQKKIARLANPLPKKHHASCTLTISPASCKTNFGHMTTNTKRAPGRHRIRPGTVGRGFRHDNNAARSALLSRRISREPSMPARSGPDTPFLFQPRERSIILAFLSQKTAITPAAHSTHSDERNTTQLIENTHNRCAPLDTLIASRGVVIREGIISRKGKHAEGKSVATRAARNFQLRHKITERDSVFLSRRVSRDSPLLGNTLI